MAKNKINDNDSAKLAEIVVKGIEEKKGKEIRCLNLTNIPNAVCDYFIICEGDSNTQVDAIRRSVEEFTLKYLNDKPWHAEGHQNAEWILLDYVNVVVHIFQKEVRHFYNLEGLWADAKDTDFSTKPNGIANKKAVAKKTPATKAGGKKTAVKKTTKTATLKKSQAKQSVGKKAAIKKTVKKAGVKKTPAKKSKSNS